MKTFFNLFGSHELESAVYREDWKTVECLCEAKPRLARRWCHQIGYYEGKFDSDVLPLHHAVTLNPPASTIETLLEAFPEAISLRESKFQRLPIHLACQHAASLEVLQVLLGFYQLGAEEKDLLGRTPLHYACSNGADEKKIKLLLETYPNGAKCADRDGWLPIHVACHYGASRKVIEMLLKVHPLSLYAFTNRMNTPVTLLKKLDCKNSDEVLLLFEEKSHVARSA